MSPAHHNFATLPPPPSPHTPQRVLYVPHRSLPPRAAPRPYTVYRPGFCCRSQVRSTRDSSSQSCEELEATCAAPSRYKPSDIC
ncbi:hypothetical protein OH76DRAFT_1409724 [Lentinus brumalis]|uniref:Uncharacterized protein n=1 Tax=Lentinus brumalis TaxID=2498619 RepID=A0A371CUF6_9APHY|nr:hypothetical protein OH76DRAFT_1409724 [Polyporus brumalis]